MPSWNVHTAHVQRLLREGSPASFGIRDVNAFLFGNFVPDVYVGYMVQHPSGILPYTLTHFTHAAHIPVPGEREFWDTYVDPTRPLPQEFPVSPADVTVEEGVRISQAGGHFEVPASPEAHEALVAKLTSPDYRANDVTLGAWAHLLCDNAYNSATRAWLKTHNVEPGETTRIRKQDDFDKFGRTLPITLMCEANEALVRQAAEFPQYAIRAVDVPATVEVADDIVVDNRIRHIEGTPEYSLFTEDFFLHVFEHATELIFDRLTEYARRFA